jgi:hypothetical protein
MSNQAVADALVIAPGTVKKHLDNIYVKLRGHNRMEAVARARGLEIWPITTMCKKIESFECRPQRALTIDVSSIFLFFAIGDERGIIGLPNHVAVPRAAQR